MAKKAIQCKVVTPAAAVFDAAVAYANVPLWDGLMGFLPGRAPILARLGKGELRLDGVDGKSSAFKLSGGFVKCADDELTILAESATAV